MTTIAWDGQTLAADSMGDQYGLRMPTTKLFEGRMACGTPCIYGAAGDLSQCRALFQWVCSLSASDIDKAAYPHQRSDGADRNDIAAILVIGGQDAYYKVGDVFVPLSRTYHAVGSGRDFAIAAMSLGLSAEEAVRLAIEFDCYSGGDVATLTLALA